MFGYYWYFFFKQKTAYERRISDWSSDVCSSDLSRRPYRHRRDARPPRLRRRSGPQDWGGCAPAPARLESARRGRRVRRPQGSRGGRSEEHTSELQSLMRISYAVFCLTKKTTLLSY